MIKVGSGTINAIKPVVITHIYVNGKLSIKLIKILQNEHQRKDNYHYLI